MVDFQDQTTDAFVTLALMQESLGQDIAGATISVQPLAQDPSQGPPVNIEVVGEDPIVLRELSTEILALLRNSPVGPKLVALESDVEGGRPELAVSVNRERAKIYGVSTFHVGQAIRGAVQGVEAAKFRTGNDEYDIVVRLRKEDRATLSALEELTVFSEGTQVPLLSVADWRVSEGYSGIRRKDMTRMATISSEVATGNNAAAVLIEVKAVLADFSASELPLGYTLSFTGQSEEQEEAMAFLSKAFLVALALIGMILVSQFNSVIKPVIILTSVVMSTAGVMLGLLVFKMPFVVIMTGVGIISLAGIVVNNAIVLIDYIDVLRERDGMDRREALIQGGKTRFRPVMLTAITTAVGLIPLAIGLNFDFFGLYSRLDPDFFWGGEQAAWWGSMAVAVIVGILFATVLTLILVPVMYAMVDDFTHWFGRIFLGEQEPAEEGTAQPSEELGEHGRPTSRRVPELVGTQ
jgi:multidrug efflux pump subunit AcrB